MQLNTSFIVHGILDNTKKSLVRPSLDDDGLSNKPIPTEAPWWWSHRSAATAWSVQSRVELVEFWASCLLTTALRGQGSNIRAADGKDARVFEHLSSMNEEDTAMDVQDSPLAAFSTMLFHGIVVPDLRSVAIGSHGISVFAQDALNLGMEHCTRATRLIYQT
jgi:hypothetical protein